MSPRPGLGAVGLKYFSALGMKFLSTLRAFPGPEDVDTVILQKSVSHKIFIFDNLHVEVAFRPTDQKYLHTWLVVYLLYNDKEIFFEPQGIQVQSNGFSQKTQQKLKELFVDGCRQELKFTVYKAKNFISDVLEYMTTLESSSEYGDTNSN